MKVQVKLMVYAQRIYQQYFGKPMRLCKVGSIFYFEKTKNSLVFYF